MHPSPPDETPAPTTRARRRAFAILAVPTALVAAAVGLVGISRSNGIISYAIDDAYIHLTLARNLAHEGTWGVVPGRFESASSSPGWTLLLAPLTWLPLAAWVPLVLNVLAAGWLLWQLSALRPIRRAGTSREATRFAWSLYPIAVGLVPLMLTGMEHTLHAAVVVAVLLVAMLLVPLADQPTRPDRRVVLTLAVLLVAGTLLRPETAFVGVGLVVAVWTVGRSSMDRRAATTTSAVIAAAVALPLVGTAALNLAFGQDLLPNSVVAKTLLSGGGGVLTRVSENLTEDPLLIAVALLALVALARRPGRRAALVLVTMLITTALHLVLADVGWMQRYQAYLIIGLSVGLIEALPAVAPRRREPQVVAVTLALLVAPRLALTANTTVAMSNVANMQARMALVLADVAPGQAIAVNDLGWVAWLHDGAIVDLAGLGSHEVLALRKDGALDRDRMAEILEREGVVALAVYDQPFAALVPRGWIAVGQTCVNEWAFVLSAPCVSWYAPDGATAEELRASLEEHAAEWGTAMRLETDDPAG